LRNAYERQGGDEAVAEMIELRLEVDSSLFERISLQKL